MRKMIYRKEEKNDSQLHYEQLRKFLEKLVKYTLIALGIIVTASTYFLFTNTSELKKESTEAIKSMQVDTRESINETREIALNKIESIKELATTAARNAAQEKIDEAFQKENISQMIETAAEQQIGEEVKRMVTKEIERITPRIQADLSDVGSISDMGSKMRIGLRSGFEDLVKIRLSGKTNIERQFSAGILSRITDDYDSVSSKNLKIMYGDNIVLNAKGLLEIPANVDDKTYIKKLISIVETNTDLNVVSIAFIVLRKITNTKINMFDFNAISNLKKEYND